MSHHNVDSLKLFEDLLPYQRELLNALVVPVHQPAGALLFEQGDLAEHLYLVTEGEVHIRYKPDDGPELIVARVRTEGVVGWSAALGSPSYTSSAICSTDCYLLRLRGRELRDLYARDPDTGKLVVERLIKRSQPGSC